VSGPLAGIRVLEIGTLIAAPFAGRIMAEFGADVIKIESASGDPLRTWRKLHKGTSLWWYLQSRNKRSIALNLKSPDGLDIVKRLVEHTDVLIENFKPGTLERLGLGWDVLSAINPKLTLVRISGFGQTGPYKDRPGFGAIGEAMGGIRFTTGEQGKIPSRVGVSLGDSLASLHGVIGALMSLLRVKTGQGPGQVIDVSLVESVFNIMESLIPEYDKMGFVRERTGGALPGISPSNTYETSDNQFIVIAGNSDAIFRRLMALIGRADLKDDSALQTNEGRVARNSELDAAIADWTASFPAATVLAALEQAQIPASRIYSVADIAADPHFAAREMLQTMTLPDGTPVRMPGIVPKLSATPGEVRWAGPALSAHADEVLGDLGLTGAEIKKLRSSGAVV
jgi:crotonobetainyl-CoA:carnitine CoA-transferase CaiB-like acyl-CoA transferase